MLVIGHVHLQRGDGHIAFLQRAEGRLKNTIFLLIEKLLARIPVTFIACSPSEAEQIRANLSQRVVVVNNAVDLAAIPAATGNEGIVDNSVDTSIANLCALACDSMQHTDRQILEIMVNKAC